MYLLQRHIPSGCCAQSLPIMPAGADLADEPRIGDAGVCVSCGAILRLAADRFVPIEPVELLALITDERCWPQVTEMLAAIGQYETAA